MPPNADRSQTEWLLFSLLTRPYSIYHLLLINLLNFALVLTILVQAVGRNFIQTEDGLVGVLDEDELAVLPLETHVDDGADNTPSVGQRQVHLVGEVSGLPADNPQDDVLIVRLW